jgi:hypothetical protein
MPGYRNTLPVHSGHVAIVLGRNFSTLNKIKTRFNVGVHFNKAEPEQDRPMPYFVVCGQEKQVHLCINEIQRLVIISMSNYIKRFKPDPEPQSSYGTGGRYGEQHTHNGGASQMMRVDKDSGFLVERSPVATLGPETPEPPKSPDYSPPENITIAPVPQTKKKNKVKVKFIHN